MRHGWLIVLALSSGCSFGAGPVVGYGQRGFVLGGEAGGGILGLEATAGYESGLGYARLDYDTYGDLQNFDRSPHPVARLGLGAGFTTTTRPDGYQDLHWHAMATAGLGAWRSGITGAEACQRQDGANAVAATIELRYAGQFEVVVVPRYVRISPFCGGE